MSTQDASRQHREARHREDKPSKRRHPQGKRHQSEEADSRPITEADLDSEASSLQDDDDLVESLSRSSSRRTTSSRNQTTQQTPGGPPPPTPITTKAHSPANLAQSPPKATQPACQPAGPPPPTPIHQTLPPPTLPGQSFFNGGTPSSRCLGPPIFDKWHLNVGGIDVTPYCGSASVSAGRNFVGGHMDHHSRTDSFFGSQSVQSMDPTSAHLGTLGHWQPTATGHGPNLDHH